MLGHVRIIFMYTVFLLSLLNKFKIRETSLTNEVYTSNWLSKTKQEKESK